MCRCPASGCSLSARAVPERLDVDPNSQGIAGRAVTEIVQPDRRQPRLERNAPERQPVQRPAQQRVVLAAAGTVKGPAELLAVGAGPRRQPVSTYSAVTSRPRRAASARSWASWLPDSCSSLLTRAQIAHRPVMRISLRTETVILGYGTQVSGPSPRDCSPANMRWSVHDALHRAGLCNRRVVLCGESCRAQDRAVALDVGGNHRDIRPVSDGGNGATVIPLPVPETAPRPPRPPPCAASARQWPLCARPRSRPITATAAPTIDVSPSRRM
jgi:hypothetical protein